MDVDGDEEGSQHPVRIQDFGVLPDFSDLDDDEKEVSCVSLLGARTKVRLGRRCRN
jgi:hypothetical protein